MVSAELKLPIPETPNEELQQLYQSLLDSGLRFHQAVEELGLYSKSSEETQLGKMLIHSEVYGGRWSFSVGSEIEYPFGEKIPFCEKELMWLFGKQDKSQKSGLFNRRRVSEIDPNFLQVFIYDRDSNTFRIDLHSPRIGVWNLEVNQVLKTKGPLGTVKGEQVDMVKEYVRLWEQDGVNLLSIERGVEASSLRVKLSGNYRYNEQNSSGGKGKTLVPESFEKTTIADISSKQGLRGFNQREIIEVEGNLLGSFPDEIDIVDLVKEHFGRLIEVTDLTIRDLREASTSSVSSV